MNSNFFNTDKDENTMFADGGEGVNDMATKETLEAAQKLGRMIGEGCYRKPGFVVFGRFISVELIVMLCMAVMLHKVVTKID